MNPVYSNSMVYAMTAARPEAAKLAKLIAQLGTGLRVSSTMLLDSVNKMVLLGFSYAAALMATTLLFHLNRILRTRFLAN